MNTAKYLQYIYITKCYFKLTTEIAGLWAVLVHKYKRFLAITSFTPWFTNHVLILAIYI